ncbi:uncharacterized protein BO66DRAFT_438143 [Aspergillus aculeatinus CBS 121060]|uniref:Uncharacterized protein n=1 Tax=Aspergillus aculeatinus CBS 121060 TaxID=1448322 RepID=A0ACD1HA50_9EURO|nr:hypothetical protein BO66DRAFT_438143 [Aspergillus aculeatinus CBS 121060]RAH70515.1 hypothetical protein BO66DRAFT_438143 [Aspergillus aculeatinus CBS 121060]
MSRIPDLLGTGYLLPVPEYSFTEEQSKELKHLLQCHESAITTIDFCMDELCGALKHAKVQLNQIEEQREDLDSLEDSIEQLRFRPEHKTSTLWAGTLQDHFFPRMFGVSPSDERHDWDAPSASVPIPAGFLTLMTQTSLVEPKQSDKIPSSALEWTLHRIAFEVNLVHGINACMTYVQSRTALTYDLRWPRARLSGVPDFTVISRLRNRCPRVRFVIVERDTPMSWAPDTELLAYLFMVHKTRRDACETNPVVYGLATHGDTMAFYRFEYPGKASIFAGVKPYKGAGFGHDIVTILWKIFIESRHVERHPWGLGSDGDSSGTEGGSDEHVRMKE